MLREQLARTLDDIGLPRSSKQAHAGEAGGVAGVHRVPLVRAILCAGLYPNVVRVKLPDATFVPTAHGAVEAANTA